MVDERDVEKEALEKEGTSGAGQVMSERRMQRERTTSDRSGVRSMSPAGTATTHSTTTHNTRRDHVSVGSRVSRIVVVRPPYAMRDELDFERRPRSNTVGTLSGADGARANAGRHPGIQPSTFPEQSTRSHDSSNASTAVGSSPTEGLTEKDKQEQDSSQQTPRRPDATTRQSSLDASRWLAFTIPTKYKKRIDEYMARSETQQEGGEQGTSARRGDRTPVDSSDSGSSSESDYHHHHYSRRKREKRKHQYDEETGKRISSKDMKRTGSRRPSRKSSRQDVGNGDNATAEQDMRASSPEEGLTMGARVSTQRTFSISANEAQTPGWSTPWHPGPRRAQSGANLERSSTEARLDGIELPGRVSKKVKNRAAVWQRWLIDSALAPLVFRILNLAFSATILGIAVNIRQISSRNDVLGIMGSSTTFAIVTAPLSILHIFFNTYAEYFGPPIGVWRIRSKMFYTFSELIFICLWSALLSLAFDDLFTSSAGCTSYTPNAQFRSVEIGSATADGSIADQLCDNQTALVSLVFVGNLLYVTVLIVSLFRIFAKVTRI